MWSIPRSWSHWQESLYTFIQFYHSWQPNRIRFIPQSGNSFWKGTQVTVQPWGVFQIPWIHQVVVKNLCIFTNWGDPNLSFTISTVGGLEQYLQTKTRTADKGCETLFFPAIAMENGLWYWTCGYSIATVDGSEIRLTSWYDRYPIIYRVLAPSHMIQDFWTINSTFTITGSSRFLIYRGLGESTRSGIGTHRETQDTLFITVPQREAQRS